MNATTAALLNTVGPIVLMAASPWLIMWQDRWLKRRQERIDRQFELSGRKWAASFDERELKGMERDARAKLRDPTEWYKEGPERTLRYIGDEWNRRQLVRPAQGVGDGGRELLRAKEGEGP